MYAFIVDLVDFLHTGHIRYFLLFFVLIWLRWLIINVLGLFYKPYTAPVHLTSSVIIPVVDEAPDVFKRVLYAITRQKPDEVIVIINGPRNKPLEQLCARFNVICQWTPQPGKRHALEIGTKLATGDILVLVDSDTVWSKATLCELIKPFADERVGGVTTQQRILDPTNNLLHRLCAWLEDIRANGTMRAMSVTGQVGCLPGRTIAFRKAIIDRVLPEFMSETFLGFHKEVSDDRSLTNLTLRLGYKTVLQSTAVVYTEAPETWRKFFRQQLRWAEGSQYNNVKMSAWMLRHAPLMFFLYWTDTLLPFMLWGMYLAFLFSVLCGLPSQAEIIGPHNLFVIAVLTASGAYLSYAIRQLPTIKERSSHLLYIPFYILFLSFCMAPIRMLGFARLADDLGWGTRKMAYHGHA